MTPHETTDEDVETGQANVLGCLIFEVIAFCLWWGVCEFIDCILRPWR